MRVSFILSGLIGVVASLKMKVPMINGLLMVLFDDHRRVLSVIITVVVFLTLLFYPGPFPLFIDYWLSFTFSIV